MGSLLLYTGIRVYMYVWACVSCVMLATVPGHNAGFLSLLFQRPRLEVFRRLT